MCVDLQIPPFRSFDVIKRHLTKLFKKTHKKLEQHKVPGFLSKKKLSTLLFLCDVSTSVYLPPFSPIRGYVMGIELWQMSWCSDYRPLPT